MFMKLITILTGPAASGKNTIAHLYATQFCERCSVIDVDIIRGMLRQPHLAPWNGEEGLRQHRLGVKHACLLARSFVEADYEVLILDVVWADLAQQYHPALADYYPEIVQLMPTWEASLDRIHNRPHTITDAEARWVYDTQLGLRGVDHQIDNSAVAAVDVATWLHAINHMV